MKIVKENINFERGMDPRDSLNLGLENVIPNQFRELKKIDKNDLIFNWFIESWLNKPGKHLYDYFYLFLNKSTKGERDEVKEKIKLEIDMLMEKTGLDEYFIFDSFEDDEISDDQISYKIKPEHRKVFKKLQNYLNNDGRKKTI